MISRGQIRASQKYRDTGGAAFLSVLSAAFALFISAKFIDVFHIFQYSFFTHIFALLTDTKNYLDFLNNHKFKSFFFYLIPTFCTIASALLAWMYFGKERDSFVLLRGRRLLRGREAIKSARNAFKTAVIGDEKGLELLPNIHITRSQEVKSILVCGAQGGGKTVFINQLLTTILTRGDRCIIFDPTKGDFSTWIPNSLLISSTDSRSSHWWLGYDITTLSDAQAFAQGMIEESSEPIWSSAARSILVTCIMKLQNELGQNWSWPELAELVFLPINELKEVAEKHYPPSISLLDEASKTSQSMVMNMVTYMVPVYILGNTFSKIQGKKLSLVSWLNSNKKQKNLVIQMNQRDAQTGSALSRAIVELLTSRIASLEFLNSKSRRICFSLDEIPQFGRLDNISRLMEVGRSKGVYTIFGFQDIAQINQLYPQHESQKWSALFGLRVFPQVVGRDSQEWVCGQIGEQEVQYLQKSVSGQGDGKQNVSMSYSQPTNRQVLLSSELELFGKRKNGVETLFLGLGANALALTVPFVKIEELRPAHVPWPTLPTTPPAPTAEGEVNPSPPVGEHETDGNGTPFPDGEKQTESTPTTTDFVVDEETQQTEMLQILDSFPTPETPPTEEKSDTPEDEILGNVVGNVGEHVMADVVGIPVVAIDLFEMLNSLQDPDTQNIQQENITIVSKKKERKARKYNECSNQQ